MCSGANLGRKDQATPRSEGKLGHWSGLGIPRCAAVSVGHVTAQHAEAPHLPETDYLDTNQLRSDTEFPPLSLSVCPVSTQVKPARVLDVSHCLLHACTQPENEHTGIHVSWTERWVHRQNSRACSCSFKVHNLEVSSLL